MLTFSTRVIFLTAASSLMFLSVGCGNSKPSSSAGYKDDPVGRVLPRDEVLRAIESAQIPSGFSSPVDPDQILTYEHDEFTNSHIYTYQLGLPDYFLSFSIDYSGDSIPRGTEVSMLNMVFHSSDDVRMTVSVEWIVDDLSFQTLPDELPDSIGGGYMVGTDRMSSGRSSSHITTTLGINLVELIAKAEVAKFRFADETYTLTETDKNALAAFCELSLPQP